MSKTIQSPVKRFPGSITLPDFLTVPQSLKVEEGLIGRRQYQHPLLGEDGGPVIDEQGNKTWLWNDDVTELQMRSLWLPGICACVERWDLEGHGQLTPDTFPSTPRVSAAKLIDWVTDEILKMYQEDESDPNAS